MGHINLHTIETPRSCNHHKRQNENIIDTISSSMLLQPHPKNFPEGNKNGNFLTWTGLKNQNFLKHIPPSIATSQGNLDQERKNLQSTKQVKSYLEIE